MSKTRTFLYLFLCSLLFLTGCLQTYILEELGIATIYGFDKAEEKDTVRSTVVLFQFNPDVTDASQIIHSEGTTFREIRNNANKKSGYNIVSGQLRTVLFGPELAKEGIFPYIDTLKRDASISDLVYVAVSNQSTEDVLSSTNYEQSPNIGTYIQRLIESAISDERLMSNTLHEFTRLFFTVGHDPLLPIVGSSKDKAQLTGVAVLKKDKVVGQIDLKELFYTRLVTEKFREGQIEMTLPFNEFENYLEKFEEVDSEVLYIVLDKLSSNTKIKVTNHETPKFKLDIEIQTRIVELSERIDLQNKKAVELIEEEVNNEVVEQIQSLISKSKELDSDFFGFGKRYQSTRKGKDLTDEEWRDMYQDIEVNIDVKTKIGSYGIIE